MDTKSIFLCFFLLSFASSVQIIPEELPSLLSVAYSNIPPIKKGTDSRVGFGFAFGNHADFQVMFELGPQTNTMPLNGQSFSSNSGNSKRQATLPPVTKTNKNREKFLQSDAFKHLQTWSQKMKHPKKPKTTTEAPNRPGDVPNLEESMVELVKNEKGHYEIRQPQPGNLPPKTLEELVRLYGKMKDTISSKKRSEDEVKKITEDLSNVDLD